MASIVKSAGGWRVQISIKGKRESATFVTKAQAQAWAAMREADLRSEKTTGIVAGKTCRNAFERYEKEVSRTKRGAKWEAQRLSTIADMVVDGIKIGDMPLAKLTSDFLGKWRDSRLKTVVGSTINRDLNLLSHVFSTATREWKWMAASPTTNVRRPSNPSPRDRLILLDEIERITFALGFDGALVETKSQAVAVAFLFAIETAMRAGEICGLLPEDVTGRVAHLPITKNGTKRDVPLSIRALELLALLPKFGNGEPLFGLNSVSLDSLFRKARNKSMIEGLTFHDTRHEAITRLAKKLNVLELARMVGHRDLRMLQIYYNETAAQLAERLD
ncbi:tyrosine-type recombinase/integrase [Collimonas fungivorans]|uniref:tyrosine-type recombinase/integrase n=1 Tax=Collimonas fungivorans TaxID=158899 RepID=UPI003FA3A474